jgi:ketosteroid isomerase-like protein
MTTDAKLDTVGQLYEAFGRGDVAAILDALTDDVDWATETSSLVAPWYGVRHGKDAVSRFLDGFSSTMEVDEIKPVSFAANDTEVLTVVQLKARTRSTGRTVAMHLHHVFGFRDGKIAYYRGTEDSAQVVDALQG